jgi:hypothetical protein
MAIIYFVSFLMAILPMLMAAFFLLLVVPRKLVSVQLELQTLRTGDITGDTRRETSAGPARVTTISSIAGDGAPAKGEVFIGDVQDIDVLMAKYFSTATLIVPGLILTLFYLAGFLLCDAYVSLVFGGSSTSPLFVNSFVLGSRPELFAFLGVYLFNLGTMTRRVYLADMNEQVFWGAINRLLLSMGLAVVLSRWKLSNGLEQSTLFFSVGFLANIVLVYLLEKTLQLMNWSKPKRDDFALQMVRGINIWKEYRLEEEGIENVQNLATADLLDLAVRTHYSVRTLIDWIDQAVVLSRFSIDQIKKLSENAVAVSAIDLAAMSPEHRGNRDLSDELASVLGISKELMANTLNSLFEDRYVQELWRKWQSGNDQRLNESVGQLNSGLSATAVAAGDAT